MFEVSNGVKGNLTENSAVRQGFFKPSRKVHPGHALSGIDCPSGFASLRNHTITEAEGG